MSLVRHQFRDGQEPEIKNKFEDELNSKQD